MKPILFNTEMVRALLDGRKSVTRRVMKPQPKFIAAQDGFGPLMQIKGKGVWFNGDPNHVAPYRPGDILYVRETYTTLVGSYLYKADQKVGMKNPGKWHPSIHMPRKAARLFLRVTGVRVERLQEIDYDGCKKEGIWDDYKVSSEEYHEALMKLAYPETFANLWDSTIKKADLPRYGWAANPWVWVIEFERISKEEAIKNA